MRLLTILIALLLPFSSFSIDENQDYFGRYQAALAQGDQAEVAKIKGEMQGALWPARDDGKWGYINRLGEWVIPPQYDDAYYFVDATTALVCMEGLWGSINRQGQFIAKPQWRLDNHFDIDYLTDDWLFTDLEGRWLGFNGKTGHFVTSVEYDHNMSNTFGADSITAHDNEESRYRFYDVEGKEFLSNIVFSYAEPFNEDGYALVIYEGSDDYCLIDRSGSIVKNLGDAGETELFPEKPNLLFKYPNAAKLPKDAWIGDISERGYAWVVPKHEDFTSCYCLYDLNEGRLISDDGWYGVSSDRRDMFRWHEGISLARREDRESYFREDGTLLYPDGFKYCERFMGGLAQAITHDNRLVYVDAFGHYVWQEAVTSAE